MAGQRREVRHRLVLHPALGPETPPQIRRLVVPTAPLLVHITALTYSDYVNTSTPRGHAATLRHDSTQPTKDTPENSDYTSEPIAR